MLFKNNFQKKTQKKPWKSKILKFISIFTMPKPWDVFRNKSHIFVFKKCVAKNLYLHTCLVVLAKPRENFKCNEGRDLILNKHYAKYRISRCSNL